MILATTTHRVDDSLEVLTPEGWDGPAPSLAVRRRARQPFRVTPKQVGALAGFLVAATLFAAYAAVAVSGIRSLERDRERAAALTTERERLSNRLLASVVTRSDTAVVAAATRDLLLEHKARVLELADHAAGVTAVDPGVRGLRDALVDALHRDAHDLDHAATAPVPSAQPPIGRGYPRFDRVLDEVLRQWRLDPGGRGTDDTGTDPPGGRAEGEGEGPKLLTAADHAFVRLATWSDAKTATRLLVHFEAGLRLLDLDASQPIPVEPPNGEGIDSVTAAPDHGFFAVSGGRQVVFIDAADPERQAAWTAPEPAERILTPDAAGHGVWVQDPIELFLFHLDRGARPDPNANTPYAHGELLADFGPTMLWNVPGDGPRGSDGRTGAPPYLNDYVLSNAETDDVVAKWQGRELLAASAHGIVWRVAGQTIELTDPVTGRPRPVPSRDTYFPRAAAWAHDGRLAIGWGDGRLDIVDFDDSARPTVAATIPTDGTMDLHWNPSGDIVFFTSGIGLGWYRPGEPDVHRLRLRSQGSGSLVAAF